MTGQRTAEIGAARRGRLVSRAQGVPPAILTFSSRRTMENSVGTVYNLPCALETGEDLQNEDGDFLFLEGFSDPDGPDIVP